MDRYWTYCRFTYPRACKAFVLGVLEFRNSFTTRFWDPRLTQAYNIGRNWAHRLTFRRYEEESL